jgi:hypothetical protein
VKRTAWIPLGFQAWNVALASTLAGCHAGSVCNPPGSTQGQIVNVEASTSYLSRVAAENGAAAHMACKAEANIPITLQVMVQDNVTGNLGRGPHVDPRMYSPPNNRDLATGEYRVLGVGRGIDRDDCGNTALQACSDAIDAYFKLQQANRPVGIVCRLSENQDACRQ